ncbi:MAG: hypothetical protein ACP5UH_02320 [Candidatus Micrarchaeia archaeon]
MANGTSINASAIKVGDIIMSYDFATGKLVPSVITDVQEFEANNTYLFNNNLKVDSNEVMYINGKWERAKNAKVGDYLYTPGYGPVEIKSIEVLDTGGMVYDFLGGPINDYIANGYVIDTVESQ